MPGHCHGHAAAAFVRPRPSPSSPLCGGPASRGRPIVIEATFPSECARCAAKVDNDAQAFIHACLHSNDPKWVEHGNASKLNRLQLERPLAAPEYLRRPMYFDWQIRFVRTGRYAVYRRGKAVFIPRRELTL